MDTKKIQNRVKGLAQKTVLIVRAAGRSFSLEGGARGAAGMAYYMLFSFFPLLIVLVTIISFFVDSVEATARITQLIISVIPVSVAFVDRNISRILELRNSLGLVSLLAFIWSSSNAFSMMVHHITSGWPEAEQRSFFQKKLLGLAMVIVIILVLFLLMLSSTLLNVLLRYKDAVPGLELLFNTWLWNLGTKVLYWAVPFLFFYSLYRIIPMGRVPIKAAGFSALVISVAWRVASSGFQWYLASGLANYEVVFGSLSTIAVFMLWIYISSLILFFGGHICAAASGKIELGSFKEIQLPKFRR